MTALINDRATPERTVKTLGLPVAVGTPICFKGARACIDTSSGMCVPGKASSTLVPVGLFVERVDNRAGSQTVLAQVTLDREVLLRWYANDGTVTSAKLLQDCYILDDQTVSMNATGASKSGRIWQVDAVRGVAVETGAAVNANTIGVMLSATNGSSQSIPPGAITQVTNWTTVIDNAAAFNAVTGVWTCPRDGIYSIAAQFAYGQALDASVQYVLQIVAGSRSWIVANYSVISATSNGYSSLPPKLVQLAAGDTVKANAFHLSSQARAQFGVSPENTFLTIQQVA